MLNSTKVQKFAKVARFVDAEKLSRSESKKARKLARKLARNAKREVEIEL